MHWSKLIAWIPSNRDLCYNLAFKFAQSKNPKVLTLCDSLLQHDTMEKNAEPWYFKGMYYSNINEKAKALEYFNKAIQANYSFLDAYMDKGQVLYDEKKYAEAISVFQLALRFRLLTPMLIIGWVSARKLLVKRKTRGLTTSVHMGLTNH